MPRRPLRPSFGPADEARLIEAMRTARSLAGQCAAASGFGSPRYRLVLAMGASIDALAQDLTGDPALFAAEPHGG
jgi:hypothetical protein